MCGHTVGGICADMPLPTPAVPLLGTPIASMLVIRVFKGEGERLRESKRMRLRSG